MTMRRTGANGVTFHLASDEAEPVFHFWKNGTYWTSSKAATVTLPIGFDESPIIDISDNAAEQIPPGRGNAGLIRWNRTASQRYTLERDAGFGYVVVQNRTDDPARTHEFAITGLGNAGETYRLSAFLEGELQSPVFVIPANPKRMPVIPAVSITFSDATKTLTVA